MWRCFVSKHGELFIKYTQLLAFPKNKGLAGMGSRNFQVL